jgi:selenocysteine lyase/cysteine desulfurase
VDAVGAAKRLADEGFGVWAHDNWFSLGLREKLPYQDSAIRVGLIHYNTPDEIDRFNAALARL